MYSQTFLTASVRETWVAPTNFPSSEDTGTGFCIPDFVLVRPLLDATAVAVFFAAAISDLPANDPTALPAPMDIDRWSRSHRAKPLSIVSNSETLASAVTEPKPKVRFLSSLHGTFRFLLVTPIIMTWRFFIGVSPYGFLLVKRWWVRVNAKPDAWNFNYFNIIWNLKLQLQLL